MSNIELQKLAAKTHDDVHATPNQTHGFDEDDVMNASVLLHAIVMDYGAAYLLPLIGQENASKEAERWGKSLHDLLIDLTGVDTHNHKFPGEQ